MLNPNNLPPALIEIVAALDSAFARGAQFYVMQAGGVWLAFYSGPAHIH